VRSVRCVQDVRLQLARRTGPAAAAAAAAGLPSPAVPPDQM
jgi:hypothetical protein